MEGAHFSGYSLCIGCLKVISKKDIHDHILNCLQTSPMRTRFCIFCGKQIDNNEFIQHIEICHEQENSSSKPDCSVDGTLVGDLTSHSHDDCDNQGHEIPRTETPIQVLL